MNKQQLLGKIDKAWSAFQASYAGLTDEQLAQPGVTGDWSVKDILAHVTVWEEETLKHLPHILEGQRPPKYSDLYGGIDAFNALKTEENRNRSLADVLARFENTHRQLIDYLRSAPEEQFATETRFRRRIRLDTYSHYPIHTQAIRKWREQNGI
jgi:uncharacterized protein (TIGR03083 family)